MMSADENGVLERAIDLLLAVLRDSGRSGIGEIARALEMPASTAHRLLARLQARGLVERTGRGRYAAGLALAGPREGAARWPALAQATRPILRGLATRLCCVCHLGILDSGMVTYVVKEAAGPTPLFTREAMQLEAYCSAVGKVLLAHLSAQELERYLAEGVLVALTPRTITDGDALRTCLAAVRMQDYALDDRETDDDLSCVAVPLRDGSGAVIAALSAAATEPNADAGSRSKLEALRQAAGAIEEQLRRAGW